MRREELYKTGSYLPSCAHVCVRTLVLVYFNLFFFIFASKCLLVEVRLIHHWQKKLVKGSAVVLVYSDLKGHYSSVTDKVQLLIIRSSTQDITTVLLFSGSGKSLTLLTVCHLYSGLETQTAGMEFKRSWTFTRKDRLNEMIVWLHHEKVEIQ